MNQWRRKETRTNCLFDDPADLHRTARNQLINIQISPFATESFTGPCLFRVSEFPFLYFLPVTVTKTTGVYETSLGSAVFLVQR